MDVDIENVNLFDGLSLGGGRLDEKGRGAACVTPIDDIRDNAPDVANPALRLVHRSTTSQIYLRPNTNEGLKVVLLRDRDSGSTDQELVRAKDAMLRERRMTNDLAPQSSQQRRITGITTFDGHPAFAFEWVDGVSLDQWLRNPNNNNNNNATTNPDGASAEGGFDLRARLRRRSW